jgi:hypothetical protein
MEMIVKVKNGWLQLPKTILDKFNLDQNNEFVLIDNNDYLVLKIKPSTTELEIIKSRIRKNLEVIESLQENWDEEDAQPFSKEHLQRVEQILNELIASYHEKYNETLPAPGIFPVQDATIDLHWVKPEEYDILVNIPPNANDQITFSCIIKEINRSSSSCNVTEISQVLLPWLEMALIPK